MASPDSPEWDLTLFLSAILGIRSIKEWEYSKKIELVFKDEQGPEHFFDLLILPKCINDRIRIRLHCTLDTFSHGCQLYPYVVCR